MGQAVWVQPFHLPGVWALTSHHREGAGLAPRFRKNADEEAEGLYFSLALPVTGGETLDKSLNVSQPLFPHGD